MVEMMKIKFYGRMEEVPVNCQGDTLMERLRELGEGERLCRLSLQQMEADSFRSACFDYARMLKRDNRNL